MIVILFGSVPGWTFFKCRQIAKPCPLAVIFKNLMTSKFSLRSFLLPLFLIPGLVFCLTIFLIFPVDNTKTLLSLGNIALILFLTFTLAWLFFGEFRSKMIKVVIGSDFLIVKKYGGLSTGKRYSYSNIDGFKISILRSATTDNEYLYLIQANKKIAKISDFYHKNYRALKGELKTKLKDLGIEKFSYVQELKETFALR